MNQTLVVTSGGTMNDIQIENQVRNWLLLWVAQNIGGPGWIEKELAGGKHYSDIQFYHQHTRAFEMGAEILQKAGILDNSYRMLIDPENFKKHITGVSIDQLNLDRILSPFLQIARYYEPQLETGYKVSFKAPPEFGEILSMLSKIGYLNSRNGKYEWSDKAKPALEDAYLWGEGTYEGFSEAQEIDNKKAQLPGSVVDEIRSLINSGRKIEAIQLLRHRANLSLHLAKKAVDEELM